MNHRAGLLAMTALGWAAQAEAQPVTAADPRSIVQAMQAEGYAAKLTTDKAGDPMIESAASGTKFVVFFYNCTGNRNCGTIQFHAGFDLPGQMPLDRINRWNIKMRFGRAFVDEEGDPIVQMDVSLDKGGMSRPLFADNLAFWVEVLGQFQQHIADPAEPQPRSAPAISL